MATATKRNVVMLGPCFPTTVKTVSISATRRKVGNIVRLTLSDLIGQSAGNPSVALLDGEVELVHHILEILALQVTQCLHAHALDLLHVSLDRRDLIVHWGHPAHDLVETLVLVGHILIEHIEEIVHPMRDDLDAVVDIHELILLRFDVCGEDVLEHLRNVGVGLGTLLVALFEHLSVWVMDAGWGLDFLPLVVLGFLILLVASRLLASVGICGGDDEAVDFE